MLGSLLDALVASGVREVCLVIGYLGEQIQAYAGDGSAWDLQISYRRQERRRGTADALRQAADFLSAPSFLLAADYVLPPDYLRQLKQAYLAAERQLAVNLRPLRPGEAASRSSVRFDERGEIVAIVEKPTPGHAPSAVGATLIYIVPPEIRGYLDAIPLSRRGEYELTSVFNQMLADGYRFTTVLQPAPVEWSPPEGDGRGKPAGS